MENTRELYRGIYWGNLGIMEKKTKLLYYGQYPCSWKQPCQAKIPVNFELQEVRIGLGCRIYPAGVGFTVSLHGEDLAVSQHKGTPI